MAATALAIAPGIARADDKQDELTVLPWTDAGLVFSSAEKRATVSYAQALGDEFGFLLKLSAPLDEQSHLAALTDSNRLVGGFASSLRFGWDTRAHYLSSLASDVKRLVDAVAQLSSLANWTSSEFANRFVASLPPVPGSPGVVLPAIVKHFCPVLGRDNCSMDELLLPLCVKYFKTSCTNNNEFYASANQYWSGHCKLRIADDQMDACGFAGAGTEYLEKTGFNEVNRLAGDADLRKKILAALKQIDTERATEFETCSPTSGQQCLIDQAEKILKAINTFQQTAALEQRDFVLTAIRRRGGWDATSMLRTSLSYDRAPVYQTDVAGKAKDAVAYDFAIGPDITVYSPVEGLTFNGRAGYERSRQTGASAFTRCATLPTVADSMVSGTRCNSSALFRSGPEPDAEGSAFVRAAVDFQYRKERAKDTLIPGVELRGGISGIGQDLVGEMRFALFGTPVSGNTAARVGVALDIHYAIDHDSGDASSRWAVTPLVFVGATLADLLSN